MLAPAILNWQARYVKAQGRAPSKTQVRYYWSRDEAERIESILEDLGVVRDAETERFSRRAGPRHYGIWFSRDSLRGAVE